MASARTDKFAKRAIRLSLFCFAVLAKGTPLHAAIPAGELAGVLTGALGIGVSEYYKDRLVPDEPRWKTPPAIDAEIRNGLKWSNPNAAHVLSNIMVLGVIVPAGVLTPLATKHDYTRSLLTVGEAAVAAGVITQILKFSVARERPYSYYGAQASKGAYDRVSFSSGHTAYAFSIAVSSAVLLAESYPNQAAAIYGTALALASFTGYLRISGDHHYFTDVLTGALIGGAIGFGVAKLQLNANSAQYGDERRLQLQRVFVLP